MVPFINELFGWFWIGMGMTVGVWMGMRFRDEQWLGGYGSWARRMVRLGHIAMIALGMINVLYGLSWRAAGFGGLLDSAAAFLWIVGAVLMPLVCFASARYRRAAGLFALPVVVLLLAVTLTWVGRLIDLVIATGDALVRQMSAGCVLGMGGVL